MESLWTTITSLVSIFYTNEAFLLTTHIVERLGVVKVIGARFGFDDAAFRVGGRHAALHGLRDTTAEDASELEAEQSGIVYLRLPGDGSIGTLVNGAGLAMNNRRCFGGPWRQGGQLPRYGRQGNQRDCQEELLS